MDLIHKIEVLLVKLFSFKNVVHILAIGSLIQLMCSFISIEINVVYILLPILFLYVKYEKAALFDNPKEIVLHFVGAVSILCGQFLFETLFINLLELVYVTIYMYWIYVNSNKYQSEFKYHVEVNFIAIYALFLTMNALVSSVYAISKFFQYKLYFQESFILIGISFFASVFCIVTLFIHEKDNVHTSEISSWNDCCLEEEAVKVEYKQSELEKRIRIENFFDHNNGYLDAKFSLEDLAKSLDMTKNEVSDFLNQYMQVSFYQLVAKYRVEYAKELLIDTNNLTIEAIVEASGFNSKSSFNKYFKFFVGCTPSAYRNLLMD
ncbi:helix-turn-helix domain-containing protein [Myroides albus]|uniref:Helix-turn-helix domain-containing protein n=1 Tax=Myroides albus TaxID=2562892 RepID=A0A6I3LK36_9FLAO|nr:helix-turn-helix domain-containing protein [Myroides albus]MTG98968.1 helix-turn-helix domain-containing protein [Myroides albus]UVD80229.1 helix-turn-helix domain-containing protein [Myroides albus]